MSDSAYSFFEEHNVSVVVIRSDYVPVWSGVASVKLKDKTELKVGVDEETGPIKVLDRLETLLRRRLTKDD